MGHRRGEDRKQATLFPVMLDELVPEEALVRVIDAWVGSLDLAALGFAKSQAASMGRPPYDPADLLKLYLSGYLNGIRSSRALERECQRNVECMWLLGRLAPDHKTIADFRRHNAAALVAVDAQSHLIVHHAVCSDTSDVYQLAPMAQGAAQVLGTAPQVVADAGYANGEHLQKLEDAGLTGYVAPARAVNNQADGTLYDRTAFAYDAAQDCFICPADKILKRKQICSADKAVIYAADAKDCGDCSHKNLCTRAKQRFVSRHWYEEALNANAKRVAASPHMMALRRQTVEHPFGTIKHRILGNARLLLRGLAGARAELSLAVLAYNFKRVLNMKGSGWMRQVLQA